MLGVWLMLVVPLGSMHAHPCQVLPPLPCDCDCALAAPRE